MRCKHCKRCHLFKVSSATKFSPYLFTSTTTTPPPPNCPVPPTCHSLPIKSISSALSLNRGSTTPLLGGVVVVVVARMRTSMPPWPRSSRKCAKPNLPTPGSSLVYHSSHNHPQQQHQHCKHCGETQRNYFSVRLRVCTLSTTIHTSTSTQTPPTTATATAQSD